MKYELWPEIMSDLKQHLSQETIERWFNNIIDVDKRQSTLYIKVHSDGQAEWMEKHYAQILQESAIKAADENLDVVFIMGENQAFASNEPNETQTVYQSEAYNNNQSNRFNFNPRYNFESFVVGSSNRFAHAAALAVADRPAKNYNPLFLYGGSGLGKTHLMHAIGNKILQNNPNTKILYVTSEDFINELVNYIQNPSMKTQLFRDKYRNIDVLLIDDIEFIAGKERGQEEFFHTFNHLHQNGKQVIISSDKPPRDIPLLEERLKTRLEWGLIADVSMPDYETRLAILRNKVQSEHIIIDDYILTVIATKINTNIRELEGTLNKIVAYAALTHSQITIEVAEKSINEIVLQKEKVVSASYIQDVVSKYFNLEKKDLLSTKKSNDIVYPRQIAMYLCRSQANISYPQIAREFGKKDHTTVMHACEKIEKEIKQNTNTKLIVDSLRNLIRDNQ